MLLIGGSYGIGAALAEMLEQKVQMCMYLVAPYLIMANIFRLMRALTLCTIQKPAFRQSEIENYDDVHAFV